MHMSKKNITIQPTEFRGKIAECNSIINEANATLGKPDENGRIKPVIFVDDFRNLEYTISGKINEIELLMNNVENSNKKKYQDAIKKLTEVREEISDARDNFFRRLGRDEAVKLKKITGSNE